MQLSEKLFQRSESASFYTFSASYTFTVVYLQRIHFAWSRTGITVGTFFNI